MKLLLIVPENSYRIKEFLNAAEVLGIDTFVATDSTFAPPDLAEKVFDSLEFCHPQVAGASINIIVERLGIDTVVAIDEGGIEVLEWSRALSKGLSKPPVRSLALRDKNLLRKVLSEVVLQPKVIDETEVSNFIDKGLIVKPSKGSASIGVMRVSTIAELKSAISLIDSQLGQYGSAMIEEYVEGTEHAFEGVVVNGCVVELAIFDKPHPLIGPYFAETIYVTPSNLDDQLRRKLLQTIESAIERLEIENGPIHVEVRVTSDGKIVIIDLANRSIGGRCSSALSFVGDRTLEVVLLEALTEGDASHARREKQYSGVYMVPTRTSGIVRSINGIEAAQRIPFVTSVIVDAKVGHHYETLPTEGSYLGFIFAKAPTRALCIDALEKSHEVIKIEVEADFAGAAASHEMYHQSFERH
ncbi:MAG: ATP-grasp domain-containing protein [Actinomycetota bacterium]|nr:ATP-grasp domain-containing protein [Actinomycetota bacterium]